MFARSKIGILVISFIIFWMCGSLLNASAQRWRKRIGERRRLGAVELGGTVSNILGDNNDGNPPYLGGLSLGFFLNRHWELEGAFSYGSNDNRRSLYTAKIVFNQKLIRMVPYVFAGLGGIRRKEGADLSVTRLVALGGGIKVLVLRKVAVRIEYNRTRKIGGDDSEPDINNIGVLGISIFF